MNLQDRLKRSFRLRFAVLYPFGALAVFFTTPNDTSIQLGLSFIISGLLIRIWANGYAIKLEKLTTSGPYAFVRHPLYLGTMLLVIGFVITLRINAAAALSFIILILAVYYKTMKKEENMLSMKFGKMHADYKRKVPALLPTIFPYREGEKWPFSFKRLLQSKEYKLFLWVIVMIILFHLKDEFMLEHETIDTKIVYLIFSASILGALDLLGEFIKHRNKSKKNTFFL